jgi:hypothetical protein
MSRYLIIIEETATGYSAIRLISPAASPRGRRETASNAKCTTPLNSTSTACAVRENRSRRLVRKHPTANGANGLSDMAGGLGSRLGGVFSGRAQREMPRYK